MSGFGSFSQEAYDQLKEAYAAQLLEAEEVENAGVKVGSDTLGVETASFKADWLDKTGLWRYPDGRGDYTDRKQTPDDLLAALRDEDGNVAVATEQEESDEELNLDDLSDEELDAYIDEIMASLDEEGEEDDELEGLGVEDIDDLIEEIDLLLDEESESDDDDEEIDALVDSILEGVDMDSELTDEEIDALVDQYFDGKAAETDEEEERLDEDFNADGMGDMIGEEDDAISISDKIAALKAELAELSAGLDTEETDEGEEEEEPAETVEETDSEEDPIEEEEVASDDEPA